MSPPSDSGSMPQAGRDDQDVSGHWLLARLGKRVLRPGGIELTRALLTAAEVTDADVVEFAPGLGRTAGEIIDRRPRSYTGVEKDPVAARTADPVVEGHGEIRIADAADSGLPSRSVDVVVGEAMLTMQTDRAKAAIIAEAARLLRPGGRYAIHELALTPDDLPDEVKTTVRRQLARSIKVNARPLTLVEWRLLLAAHGLVVDQVDTAPMALLEPRRLISDEGVLGAARFVGRLLARPDARHRVLTMRRTFRKYRQHLTAIAIVARKPDPTEDA